MSDTYRNHLLNRVIGGTGRPAVGPVADIAGNAARETAAKIAVALRAPSGGNGIYNPFSSSIGSGAPVGQPASQADQQSYRLGGTGAVANDVSAMGNTRSAAQETAAGIATVLQGSGGPSGMLARPVVHSRYGDTIGSVNSTNTPVPLTPPAPSIVPNVRKDTYGGLAEPIVQPEAITPEDIPGSTRFNLGGSSDELMTVPSGGYESLPVDPTIVSEAAIPGATTPVEGPHSDVGFLDFLKGGAVGAIKKWLEISDIPRQWSTDQIGAQLYTMVTSDQPPDWIAGIPGGPQIWKDIQGSLSDEDKQTIIAAYESGGGTGVWENVIAAATDEMPWWLKYPIRTGTDILVDPLAYPLAVVTGGAGVLTRGALGSAATGKTVQAAVENVASTLLGAPQRILDVSIDAPFNAAGELIGKVFRLFKPTAKALEEAPAQVATEQINVAEEATGQVDRIKREGLGLEEPPPEGGVPPIPDTPIDPTDPNVPRYTMDPDETSQQWVIKDPNGAVVETNPYNPVRGAEPNYQERLAQRRVNELNAPIIRAEDLSYGSILPPEGELTWTDPGYQKLTNRGKSMPQTIQTRVADDMSLDPGLRRQWMDTWTPKAKEHESVMADFRREESNMLARTGVSAEKDLVQKGRELLYPRKTYEMVRFYVDDALIPFNETFLGVTQRARRWITSATIDPTDANNLIEHAVLGTREDAVQARKMLRMRNVSIEGFKSPIAFIEHLADMGERLHGPSWRSTDWRATKSRAIRARQAGEAKIDPAAVNEVTGKSAKLSVRERTRRINAFLDQPAERMPSVELGQNTVEVDPVAQALIHAPSPHMEKITAPIPHDVDEALLKEIANPNTKSVTPGKNRVESTVTGEIVVKKPGSMKTNFVRIVRDRKQGQWLVIPKEGEKAVPLATLNDAIAVADEILARFGKGIDPVPAQVKRVTDDLGIVSPGTAKAINMEPRVREDILRKGGAREGTGSDWLSRDDLSYIGAAHQMGKLDDATYTILNQWVEWSGRTMKLWEAYDDALQWHSTPAEAKEAVAKQAVSPEIKAILDAKALAVKNRGAGKRALFKAFTGYEQTLRFLREAIMFNWARGASSAFADMSGNAYTLAINGEVDAAARGLDIRTARHFINDERGKKLVIDNLPGMERYKYVTGFEPPASVIQLVETRFETGHQRLALERLGGAYNLVRPIADKDIKAFRVGMDRNNRFGLHMSSFDRNLNAAQIQFRGIVATRAQRTGNDYVDWLRKLDQLGDTYNPDDVLHAFGDQRLARDWRELTSKARMDAKQRVDQLLFSYKMTNADNALRNVVFFHYWMSRAIPLHAKTAFKNPWLLNAYARTWERMEAEAEENGYPPNVRGFIQMQGSKSGFYGLINPIQVLVPFSMLIEGNDDPGVFAFLKRWGFFINPVIEGAAASLGWTQTMPDVTGTMAVRRAFRYTVNWLNANGHEGLVPDVLGDPNTWQPSIVDEAQYRIIDQINTWATRAANALAPSQQIVSDYEGSSKNAYEYDVLNSILINELEKQYGPFDQWGPESPAWNDFLQAKDDIAMGRDGNVVADAVVEIMADAKIENTIEAAFIPGGVYQRYGPRDTTLAEARAGEEQAYDQRDLATSGNAELAVDLQQLDKIGTENGRQGYKLWNEIAYGDIADDEAIELDGSYVMGYEINKMTPGGRERLADRWLAQYEGVPEEVETYRGLRDEFLVANPQAGDFKEYQKGVGNFEGGTTAWRTMYAKKDDSFREAMGKQEARLRGQGKTGDVLDKELDRWAMTPEAYNIANGNQDSIYDAPATPKVPDYGFPAEGTYTSAKKDPMDKLADEITAYQEKLAVAIDSMNAAGYAVTEEDIYTMSPFYATIFKNFGVPNPSSDVMLYLNWSAHNPGHNSIDEFIQYLEGLAAQKTAA